METILVPQKIKNINFRNNYFYLKLKKIISMTNQEIYDAIKKFIDDSNIPCSKWYCGIASSTDRLFVDHNVDKDNGYWIYRTATSSDSARNIESALLENLKTKGGEGGGDNNTNIVYAYVITNKTKE